MLPIYLKKVAKNTLRMCELKNTFIDLKDISINPLDSLTSTKSFKRIYKVSLNTFHRNIYFPQGYVQLKGSGQKTYLKAASLIICS